MLSEMLLRAIVVVVTFFGVQTSFIPGKHRTYFTPASMTYAEYLKNNTDDRVNPCDDFYNFTCGNWKKNNPLSQKELYKFARSELIDDVKRKFRTILEEEEGPTDAESLKINKRLYKMCMDEGALQKESLQDLLESLFKSGGLPMVDYNSKNKSTSWQKTFKKISRKYLPTTSLFDIKVRPDPYNFAWQITIDAPSFSSDKLVMRSSIGNQTKYLKCITETIQSLAKLSNYVVSSKDVEARAQKIIALETKLANVVDNVKVDAERFRDLSLILTIEKLQKIFDDKKFTNATAKIDLLDLISNVVSPANLGVNKSQEIVVRHPGYFEHLPEVLEQTDDQTIGDYLLWHYARQLFPYVSHRFKHEVCPKEKIFGKFDDSRERWEECIDNVNLRKAINYEYAKRHMPKNSKEVARKIYDEIRAMAELRINNTSWINDKEKEKMIKILRNIIPNFAYPDSYSDAFINNYYRNIDVKSLNKSYFKSVEKVRRVLSIKELSKIGKPVDRKDWKEQMMEVNAYYKPFFNVIDFQAGTMNGVHFHPDRPEPINYATFGTVVGHEIFHSIVEIDRSKIKEHDKSLSNNETNHVAEKLQCYVDQYSNYTLLEHPSFDPIFVSGTATLRENVMDALALEVSYDAYKNYMKNNELVDYRIDGLNYTDDQIFFLSYASTFCENARPEYVFFERRNDDHCDGPTRVIGTLSNFQPFSDAFHCSKGSNMNRRNKCQFL